MLALQHDVHERTLREKGRQAQTVGARLEVVKVLVLAGVNHLVIGAEQAARLLRVFEFKQVLLRVDGPTDRRNRITQVSVRQRRIDPSGQHISETSAKTL